MTRGIVFVAVLSCSAAISVDSSRPGPVSAELCNAFGSSFLLQPVVEKPRRIRVVGRSRNGTTFGPQQERGWFVPISHSEGRRLGAPIHKHQFARRRIVAHLEQVLNFRIT